METASRQAQPADGLTDTFVHRPCARPLVRLLIHLPVTPNAVTLTGLILGAIAALQFWRATVQSAVLGIFFYLLQAIVDHADGELARRTGRVSRLGQWLDVSVDTITAVLIFVGVVLTATPRNGPFPVLLVVLVGSGIALCSLCVNFFPSLDGRGVTRAARRLGNRDPVYVVLIAFLLLVWKAEHLLPLLVWILAVGPHVYWFVRVVQRAAAR